MNAPASPEVFLSHATADREHVELVRRQLEALGASVYLAEHDPQPGTPLAGKVEAALRRSDLVVVLFTSLSADSTFVQQEIGLAVGCRKPIVPIVDSRVAGTFDPGILAGLEYILLDVAQPALAMAQITEALRALLIAPRESAAPPLPALRSSTSPAVPQVPRAAIGMTDVELLVLLGAAIVLVLLFLEGGSGPVAS